MDCNVTLRRGFLSVEGGDWRVRLFPNMFILLYFLSLLSFFKHVYPPLLSLLLATSCLLTQLLHSADTGGFIDLNSQQIKKKQLQMPDLKLFIINSAQLQFSDEYEWAGFLETVTCTFTSFPETQKL